MQQTHFLSLLQEAPEVNSNLRAALESVAGIGEPQTEADLLELTKVLFQPYPGTSNGNLNVRNLGIEFRRAIPTVVASDDDFI